MCADGDTVIVTLKNRSQKNGEEQDEDWYEKAFGPKQNIMTIKIDFTPETKEAFKKGRNDIYAVVTYNMYEEMEGEFQKADYKQKENILLQSDKFEISPERTKVRLRETRWSRSESGDSGEPDATGIEEISEGIKAL